MAAVTPAPGSTSSGGGPAQAGAYHERKLAAGFSPLRRYRIIGAVKISELGEFGLIDRLAQAFAETGRPDSLLIGIAARTAA